MLSVLAARRRGFTLIELMIVIIVIAILALIIIPKITGARKRAQEATMVSNLQNIRSAVETYSSDNGVYPNTLMDLFGTTATSGTAPTSVASTWKGPYLRNTGSAVCTTGTPLPTNPIVVSAAGTNANNGEVAATAPPTAGAATAAANWAYCNAAGNSQGAVWPGCSGTTADGNSTPYSQL